MVVDGKRFKIKRVLGGVILFAAAMGMPVAGFATGELDGLAKDEIISVDELRQMQLRKEDFALFDARGRSSYNSAHIAGAVLPLSFDYYRQEELFRNQIISSPPDRSKVLAEAMKYYSKDQPIVTYCNRNCSASVVLLFELKRLGFKNVRALEGGTQAWEEKGYPLEVGTGLSADLVQ